MAKPCEAGTYTTISMQESCLDCPEGYYCEAGADDITDCPAGQILFAYVVHLRSSNKMCKKGLSLCLINITHGKYSMKSHTNISM